jgi:hypothetical protein
MSYRVLIWSLAAVLIVAGVTAVDIYRERSGEGPVIIASNGPVTEEKIRQAMTADGWSTCRLLARGATSKSWDRKISYFTIDSQTGRLRGGEDDD